MDGLELACFNMITSVGNARSLFIEAIQEAKEKNFEKAETLMKEGQESFTEGHHAHTELIQQEAKEIKSEISLLLIHAEDQMMSAEAFSILATEFIDLYRELSEIKKSIRLNYTN